MPTPTDREQLLLELINRARLDPIGEAEWYGIDLNEGLDPGTISTNAKAPLAMYFQLVSAARDHSQWMLDTDIFSHTGANNSTPGDRMAAAGFSFGHSGWAWGENISWTGWTDDLDATYAIYAQHRGLFLSPGHRENLLDPEYVGIGIGQMLGVFTYEGTDYNTSMVTEDFVWTGEFPKTLTGVVYSDTDHDGFYSVGEGQGGIAAKIANGKSGTTSSSGGYGITNPAGGALTVSFYGSGLPATVTATVQVGAKSVKLDLVDNAIFHSSADIVLKSGAAGLVLLGDAINGTGNDDANTLTGNRYANVLTGGDGHDTFLYLTKEDSTLAACDTITDFAGGDSIEFSYMADMPLLSGLFPWQGSLQATLSAIQADDYLANALVSFTDGASEWLYVNGEGGGMDFNGSLIKLQGRTTALSAANISGGSGTFSPTSLSLTDLSADLPEGDAGTTTPFTFMVTRDGDLIGSSRVVWSVTGSGDNPANEADFAGGILPSGTVDFAAGETSKTITVLVAGDAAREKDQTFTVTLQNPTGAALGIATAIGTIQNDDVNHHPTGSVTVSGIAAQNHLLTATNTLDDVEGLGTIDYLWQQSPDDGASWSEIAGAATSTFTPAATQVGMQVRVLASYIDGQDTAESVASPAVLVLANTFAPTVSAFSPEDGATGASVSSDVVITFDEPIQRGTGDIVLKTVTGTTVATFDAATSTHLSITGSTLTVDPAGTLAYNSHYFLCLEAGTIKDQNDNLFTGTTAYDFTTVADTSGLKALPGFDKAYYLNAKLAALQADPGTAGTWIDKDTGYLENVLASYGLTAQSHYMAYGYSEGLAPNAYFNPAEYELAKATDMYLRGIGNYNDIAAAKEDFVAKWPYDPYQHYLHYGSKEGINPSNSFDESSYYDAKLAQLLADPDTAGQWSGMTALNLKSLFDSLDITPLQHYFSWGADEGIPVTAVPFGERVPRIVLIEDQGAQQAAINLIGVMVQSEADHQGV